jgi:hypothetical protein
MEGKTREFFPAAKGDLRWRKAMADKKIDREWQRTKRQKPI